MPYIEKFPELERSYFRETQYTPWIDRNSNGFAGPSSSDTVYFQFLGESPKNYKVGDSLSIYVYLRQAPATITWAEIGLCTGTWTYQTNASLTRVGYTNVAPLYTVPGLKKTPISFTSYVAAGTHIWFAFGFQASTSMLLESSAYDTLKLGLIQYTNGAPNGPISALASPTAVTVSLATVLGVDLAVEW